MMVVIAEHVDESAGQIGEFVTGLVLRERDHLTYLRNRGCTRVGG